MHMDGVPADEALDGAADVAVETSPAASSTTVVEAAGPFDVSQLAPENLAGSGLLDLVERVYSTPGMADSLRKALSKLDGEALGVAHWILMELDEAEGILAKAKNRSEAAEHCLAHCMLRKGESNRAQQTFEKLFKSNGESLQHWAGVLTCLVAKLDHDDESTIKDLEKALAKPPKGFEGHADQAYAQGRLSEFQGDYEAAVDHYIAAIDADARHRLATEALAFQLDMRGSDDDALILYERLAAMPPVSLRTLVNLGTMYEDRAKWDKAEACFQTILELDPTDPRALLFMRDVIHSRSMFYDEDLEKKEDKLNQILRIPITDFELSVRARNCLNRMNIGTLGDLVKKTEAELLSYKNFGETSLNEIKEVLRPYGLRLGMERDDGTIDASKLQEPDPQASQDKLDLPVADLQLSVRSRRTVDRLGCKIVRDLVSRTEAELLAQPNFGHTSLNEIKHKLENLGLTLSKR